MASPLRRLIADNSLRTLQTSTTAHQTLAKTEAPLLAMTWLPRFAANVKKGSQAAVAKQARVMMFLFLF